jgi:uncharacterized iron-regulated membrane protein
MFAILHRFQYGIFALLGIGAVVLGVMWWRKRRAARSQA